MGLFLSFTKLCSVESNQITKKRKEKKKKKKLASFCSKPSKRDAIETERREKKKKAKARLWIHGCLGRINGTRIQILFHRLHRSTTRRKRRRKNTDLNSSFKSRYSASNGSKIFAANVNDNG